MARVDQHVDQQEKTLKVKRTQQPVAPDYACTAYNSQGMTLPAAIVDLCFDENMDPATAYVSLSRVKVADDILIMQAFNLKPFTQGSPLGRGHPARHRPAPGTRASAARGGEDRQG